MKRKQQLLILAIFTSWILSSCTKSEQELKEARSYVDKGQFRTAISYYDMAITRYEDSELSLLAAREAARVSLFEIKDYKKAAEYFSYLVLRSSDYKERILSQKQITNIYFDHLSDYPKSIIELNKLINMLEDPTEKNQLKIKLARAYYYQNDFTQAENEVNDLLIGNITEEIHFELLMLKGNIRLGKRNLSGAAEVFKEVLVKFPARAKKENVGLTLAVCYEEMKDYKSAIGTLEQIKDTHPTPEYIALRIKKLIERQKNQPGAKGFRK